MFVLPSYPVIYMSFLRKDINFYSVKFESVNYAGFNFACTVTYVYIAIYTEIGSRDEILPLANSSLT